MLLNNLGSYAMYVRWGVNLQEQLLFLPKKKIILANESGGYEKILLYLSGGNFSFINHFQESKNTLKEGVYLYS